MAPLVQQEKSKHEGLPFCVRDFEINGPFLSSSQNLGFIILGSRRERKSLNAAI
jgi:hypothetical protein